MAAPSLKALAAAALVVLAAACSGSQTPNTAKAHANALKYFLTQVCFPHLLDHEPIVEIVNRQHFGLVKSCDIEGCFTKYCSSSLGCVDFQENYCEVSLRGNADFAKLNDIVADVVGHAKHGWRKVPLDGGTAGYGEAYCNLANTTGVTTFGVSPGHAPASIARFIHVPTFDLHVSNLGEPRFCARTARN